jgi:hypothetical protein
MRKKAREYVLLAITVLVAVVYSLFARGWNDVAFYGAAGGILAVIVVAGMSWVEFAPDGAFRRRPQA